MRVGVPGLGERQAPSETPPEIDHSLNPACNDEPDQREDGEVDELIALAELIRRRNAVEQDISAIIGRPALIGHVGEFIASRVFDIRLERSAVAKGIDGRFLSGPLAGKTVNVKWYAKHERLLDIRLDALPDYYLVLAGPRTPAASSRGTTRPWLIESVFLFDAQELVAKLRERGVKIGVATSVVRAFWDEAELYPTQRDRELILTAEQQEKLSLFG